MHLESIKLFVLLAIAIVSDLKSAFADGKFDFRELLIIVDDLKKVGTFGKTHPMSKIALELTNLNEADLNEIAQYVSVQKQVDISHATELVGKAIQWAHGTFDLAAQIKDGL